MNTQPNNKPQANIWYKNYMVLIFVIGLPVFVVIVCLYFIYFSIKIQDSTVRDDWYMDGKTLYQDASRDKLSHDLGLGGVMRLSTQGDETHITFELRYPDDSLSSGKLRDGSPMVYPDTLSVRISHATDDSKDRDFTLTHTQGNLYQGTVKLDPNPAKYYLQVSNAGTHNWRLLQNEKLPVENIAFYPLSSFDDTQSALPDQRDKRADVRDKVE